MMMVPWLMDSEPEAVGDIGGQKTGRECVEVVDNTSDEDFTTPLKRPVKKAPTLSKNQGVNTFGPNGKVCSQQQAAKNTAVESNVSGTGASEASTTAMQIDEGPSADVANEASTTAMQVDEGPSADVASEACTTAMQVDKGPSADVASEDSTTAMQVDKAPSADVASDASMTTTQVDGDVAITQVQTAPAVPLVSDLDQFFEKSQQLVCSDNLDDIDL
jgi:hypothetical protein